MANPPLPHHRLAPGEFFGTASPVGTSTGLVISESRYRPRAELPLHAHENAYLSFVLAGDYVETVGTSCWDCRINAVRLHPAGEEHADRFGPRGGECLNIELAPDWLDQVADRRLDEPLATDECAAIVLRLRSALRVDSTDIGLTIPELVLAVLDACERARVLRCTGKGIPWWPRVAEFVEAHLRGPLELRAIAAFAGVHPTHLARVVRGRTGGTMGDYVRRRRIARAQAILRTRPTPCLSRVAHELGFSDHAHFSRTFKTITGMAPSAFRRLARR